MDFYGNQLLLIILVCKFSSICKPATKVDVTLELDLELDLELELKP